VVDQLLGHSEKIQYNSIVRTPPILNAIHFVHWAYRALQRRLDDGAMQF
jgi:hypothetical protein